MDASNPNSFSEPLSDELENNPTQITFTHTALDLQGKEVTIEQTIFEHRFTLPFSGLYVLSLAGHGVGHCPVVLRKYQHSDVTHVLIAEPKNTGSTSVTNRIEHIATQIYWGFLAGVDPRKITWTLSYEACGDSSQVYREHPYIRQPLYWNGHRFFYHRDTAERIAKPEKPQSFLGRLFSKGQPFSYAWDDETKLPYLGKSLAEIIESPEPSLWNDRIWKDHPVLPVLEEPPHECA